MPESQDHAINRRGFLQAGAVAGSTALPAEARDWHGADLEAARDACPSKLDFASLLARVDERLA